jgi:UDP-GlcNAc:undecaprenyl-phosphate/decaprenyl-phosphate GlcNAc-1-phosphate transferase
MTLEFTYMTYAYSFLLSALIAAGITELMRRLALRWQVLDHPGGRKTQETPVPLLGGLGIVLTLYIVVLSHIALLFFLDRSGVAPVGDALEAALGVGGGFKLFGILLGGLIVFAVGLLDDLHDLSPGAKLTGQLLAGLVLVFANVRIELFVFTNPWLSCLVTLFWVVLLTNAMNFLDNMDGLCGGISLIAALSFFLCVVPFEPLVRLLLLVFSGTLAGFLYHNLSPARIYMGDAGSMFCGYFLATVAVLGTFHVEGTPRVAVAAPLLALAVPLFDFFTVVYIRWRSGARLTSGDQRHFSHRLVDLGMSRRQAVDFILLVASIIGLGGALLPRLDIPGTILIIVQTVGVFLLILLLMGAGGARGGGAS